MAFWEHLKNHIFPTALIKIKYGSLLMILFGFLNIFMIHTFATKNHIILLLKNEDHKKVLRVMKFKWKNADLSNKNVLLNELNRFLYSYQKHKHKNSRVKITKIIKP